jgi:hypothetical protein
LNQKPQALDNKALNVNCKSEEVHNPVHNPEISPELQQIITAWPELPEHIKQTIKTLVESQK